jgi:hypothetical protein
MCFVVYPDPSCFWASRIRILHYFVRIGILLSTSKKLEKSLFLLFCDFFLLFSYENLCKSTFKVISKKNFEKKNLFLLASCQPVTKKVVTGSGSVSQWSGSVPYQNVTDPQHCERVRTAWKELPALDRRSRSYWVEQPCSRTASVEQED